MIVESSCVCGVESSSDGEVELCFWNGVVIVE